MAIMAMLLGYGCSKKGNPNKYEKFINIEKVHQTSPKSMIGSFVELKPSPIISCRANGFNKELQYNILTVKGIDGKTYKFIPLTEHIYNTMNIVYKDFGRGIASFEDIVDYFYGVEGYAKQKGVLGVNGVATEITKPPEGSGIWTGISDVRSGFMLEAIIDSLLSYAAKNEDTSTKANVSYILDTYALYIESQIKANKITDYNKLSQITFLKDRAKEYGKDRKSTIIELYFLAEKSSNQPEVRKRMLDDTLLIAGTLSQKEKAPLMRKIADSHIGFVREYIDTIDRDELYQMVQVAKGVYLNAGVKRNSEIFNNLNMLEKKLSLK